MRYRRYIMYGCMTVWKDGQQAGNRHSPVGEH